ncbi:MAG: 4-hydroxy-tetrahydrodipicolinate reductase [Deltaproteobacteria bacterium]|nr:4-hydroxy-tetrahydrodipicolinate reductase [Deltaproteobacteria bacterium]
MRIAVIGAAGRMGRLLLGEVLAAEDLELVAACDRAESGLIGTPAGALVGRQGGVPLSAVSAEALAAAEVVVDFSLPDGLAATLDALGGQALVTGTTGLPAALAERLTDRAGVAPVVAAANFSTGVTLLLDLVERAAHALPDADVEIVETHHRLKQDAPSGTALALGEAVADGRAVHLAEVAVHGRSGHTGVRPAGEVGFHALRGGDVVGEHQVWLIAQGERLSLGHVAHSRLTFVMGALRAARWVSGRAPGRYAMRDVLGL